ncbi:MAG: hypothetical protein LH472_00305 [Pyrinomonadaceae bacterium]|nr:hypothetical protein [Pyrinomonadaceae bacterium]
MQTTFAEVLETIENFTVDEKETLVDILQHRLVEHRRNQIQYEVECAKQEFEQGLCKPMTADEIMREISS